MHTSISFSSLNDYLKTIYLKVRLKPWKRVVFLEILAKHKRRINTRSRIELLTKQQRAICLSIFAAQASWHCKHCSGHVTKVFF